MYIATYNVRTLSSEEKLLELEEELKHIKWDVMGLCEVRREEENCITLKSGHPIFYMGNKEKIGGVGLLIHKRHTKNIQQLKGINPRIILCILKLNKKTSFKIIQAYAPTSTHSDEEWKPTTHNLVMDDFIAKLGCKLDGTKVAIGPY
ncbi:uncharacterized protein [Diabrotica undecimpunctata]|uniref:uncharacterized protein n=1 Tax=Diabrotica undecimpunctata TaxID=50387 RepID=UPI003B63B36E